MTNFVKKSEINSKWYEIDAKNAVVGRLATIISKILRGKNTPKYTPHMDHGDFVIVKNVELLKFTGNKFENKKYYKHTNIINTQDIPVVLRKLHQKNFQKKNQTRF